MQSVSSRIWTRVAVFISYDDNNYTTGTSKGMMRDVKCKQPRLGFELGPPCLFPTTVTITRRYKIETLDII